MQFTDLSIHTLDFNINVFLQLIHLLPNLSLLQVSFGSYTYWNNLSVQDVEMFQLISMKNKIIKVILEKFFGEKQIQFWIHLCPQMEYLGIRCESAFEIQRTVQCFGEYIFRIKSLCVSISESDEEFIEDVKSRIDSHVLGNYKIQGQGNRIVFNRQY